MTSTKTSKTAFRPLTEAEAAAVAAFAAKYGKYWKGYLEAAWLSHSYNGTHMGGQDTGCLRRIRNDLGFDWLRAYRLPAAR